MTQLAPRPIATDASAGGAFIDATLLQDMANDGLSRQCIANLFGCSKRTVNYWCKAYGISTTGRSPLHEVHGTKGKQTAKLLPSSAALRAVSIFHLGG